MKTELKYEYSKLDKEHQYFLLPAHNAFTSWIWFHLGKNLKVKVHLLPFHPTWHDRAKTILTAKVNSASKQGEMIAKKINDHYTKKIKSKKK